MQRLSHLLQSFFLYFNRTGLVEKTNPQYSQRTLGNFFLGFTRFNLQCLNTVYSIESSYAVSFSHSGIIKSIIDKIHYTIVFFLCHNSLSDMDNF